MEMSEFQCNVHDAHLVTLDTMEKVYKAKLPDLQTFWAGTNNDAQSWISGRNITSNPSYQGDTEALNVDYTHFNGRNAKQCLRVDFELNWRAFDGWFEYNADYNEV